jgi:hypothetical protein
MPKSNITSTIETIDPVLARTWLKKNTRNRRLRPRRVTEISEAILRGEWKLNGEAIKFSSQGVILDGQHRLKAIDQSGRAVQSLVVRGLADESQEVMDRNLSRTFADKLHIDEEKNSTILASATTVLWRFENAAFGKDSYSKNKPSFAQLDDVLSRHPDLRQAASAASSLHKKIKIPASYIAAIRVIFFGIDREDADHFFSELVAGTQMTEVDPIYRLREALNQNAMSSSKKYSSDHLLALTFKAWNLFRAGSICKNLSYRAGGAAPEAFPIPE